MFSKIRVIAGFVVVAVVLAIAADAAKTLKPQTTCPVMGGKIVKTLFVEKDGKRIYLCCEGCKSAVEKDFAGYEAKLAKKGQAVEKVACSPDSASCTKKNDPACCPAESKKVEKTSCEKSCN